MAFPTSPTDGQTYTAANGTVYYYVAAGDYWRKDQGGVLVSEGSVFPSNPGAGDRHFDTTTETWYIWTESVGAWLDLSSSGLSQGDLGTTKNAIINGDMRIWQRGTSFSGSGYAADRWRKAKGTTGSVFSTDRDTDTPNEQFNYSLKLECTTADATVDADDISGLYQRIEGYNFRKFKGQTGTLSFWTKSNKTGTMCMALRNSGSDLSYNSEFTIDQGNVWEKKVITIDFNYTGGTWNYTNGIGLQVYFVLMSGSNRHASSVDSWESGAEYGTSNQDNWADTVGNYVSITGVQLELGSTDTDFEFLDHETQLSKCERYYEKSYKYGDDPGTVTSNGASTGRATGSEGTHYALNTKFSVSKRTVPTMTWYNPITGTSAQIEIIGTAYGVSSTSRVGEGSTGAPSTSAAGALNNRKSAHWVADAEL